MITRLLRPGQGQAPHGPARRRVGLALSVTLAALIPGLADAQDLVGIVRDSVSTEPLRGAVVTIVGVEQESTTDDFGRFSLVGAPAGVQILQISRLGYVLAEIPIDETTERPITVLMIPDAIEVQGVTIRSQAQIIEASRDVSQISLNPEEISTLPTLGESDIFRALQLLPGVSGTNDASSGLFVRGGTPDENLVLLDGMTVYHVDHFFGVFSAFNADAIKDVRLFKGGYPAPYGGRTSAVVDMVGKTGNQDDFKFSGGVNLLSARTVFEIPIANRGSLLVSARRSYTDVIQSGLYNSLFSTLEGADTASATGGAGQRGGAGGGRRGRFAQQSVEPSFYFYDFNSKLTYSPSAKDVLAVSVYNGKDNLDQSASGQPVDFGGNAGFTTPDRENLSGWGNLGASARWFRQWSGRFTSDFILAGSQYFSDATRAVTGGQTANGFAEDNQVDDLTLRLDNSWQANGTSTVAFGISATRSEVGYQFDRVFQDTIQASLDRTGSAVLGAAYGQYVWSPNRRVDLTAGLRAAQFEGTGESYLEPRASVQYRLSDRIKIKGAWGLYNQFIKRVENEDILEGSRDFWVLSDSTLPPGSAEHRVLGASYETPMWLFDVEGFDKDLDGVTEFSPRSRRSPDQAFEELFFSGTGFARGVEVLAQKKRGPLTGWVSYTLSKVEYQLDGFNDDQAFPASHDQTHEFKVVGAYRVGAWTLAGNWVYGSGRPYTVPESTYTLELLDGSEFSYIHVGAKNAERLPAYNRADLSASRRWESDTWFFDINLTLYNFLNHTNVWYRQFDLSGDVPVITDVTTLGFTPSIGMSFGLK